MPYKANVLDHGFVILRNISGPTRRIALDEKQMLAGNRVDEGNIREFDADDTDPAQAARMSFDQMDSERTYQQDMKLAEYLLVNEHTSPFEMIQIWIEVKAPIFVDRQLVRHRTWRRNETSGRYTVLPEEWYIPSVVGGKSATKKQGQEDNLPEALQDCFRRRLDDSCKLDYMAYKDVLGLGVAPEHARMFLHLNHYVHWLGNVDLANMFHFLKLRTHEHAQIEARQYAWAIVHLLEPHLPGLMALFNKHCVR